MILPLSSEPTLGAAALPLALAAACAYGLALWPGEAAQRLRGPALIGGWLLHALLLVLDIGGWGRLEPGARLGFGPISSLTVWLVLAVHAVESRLLPLPAVRRVLAAAAAVSVLLAWAFPGEPRVLASPWSSWHWVLGVGAYALFGAAVLHASMLDAAERRLRRHGPQLQLATPQGAAGGAGPMGLPLLRLERLTFRFVEAGFAALTLALLLGWATAAQWRWDHKTVFSCLGWAVYAALLVGRHGRGWRGRRATRWLYVGAVLLLLAYVGSRFVLEVLLGRGAPV